VLIVRAVPRPDRAGSAPDDQHVEPSADHADGIGARPGRFGAGRSAAEPSGRIGGDDNAAERRLGAAQPAE
jgi:hypothetical protein